MQNQLLYLINKHPGFYIYYGVYPPMVYLCTLTNIVCFLFQPKFGLHYDHNHHNIFNATTPTRTSIQTIAAVMCHFVHNIVCKLLTLFYCRSDLAV